jgi:hypothetical protein
MIRRHGWAAIWAGVFAAALWSATGVAGLLYALVYLFAIAPGIVLGRRAAGPGHAAGWLIGGVLGYGLTQLALWVPIFAGFPSVVAFIGVWVVAAAFLLWTATRLRTPVLRLPPWCAADARALALTLLLVPALMGPPYRNLGAADETGTRLYRAYFTADFVWHTALAAELGRYDSPPRNPYMASLEMHYYWTYFLLPAVVAHESPPPLDDVQKALKANAMLSALLLVGMLYLFVRTAVLRPGVAAAAAALGVVAASAEGVFVLQQIWRGGRSVAELATTNIDAVTAWQFGGLRVDSLARGLWYNPQHSFACALGLVALVAAATTGAQATRVGIWLSGAALGLATTFNPFVGAVFSLIYGIGIAGDARRRPSLVPALVRHGQAAVPVLIALGWCAINEVAEGAGEAVRFGFQGFARNNTVVSLLLSTGPVLVPAVAGVWPHRALPMQPARVAAAGAAVSLLLMHLMTISEGSWVGFRTGQILLLMLPVLLARSVDALAARAAGWAVVLASAVLLAGAPTTIIDTYNTQDIGNRRMGPGFRWTIPVTPEQQEAFAWVRRHLPEDAVLQMEPVVRGRDHWSLIPTFAERRMSAGLPISLLPIPAYASQSAEIQRIYRTTDSREAWHLVRAAGIDYLYVDEDDRRAYPQGLEKFGAAYFEPVYDRGGVTIYRVR